MTSPKVDHPTRHRCVPDESWQRRARAALFGTDWNGSAAVLTPIKSIFTRLSSGGTTQDGWWPSSAVGDVLVIEVPQASAAMDAVFALRAGTLLTFVGLAGGLRDQQPGVVIDPSSAVQADCDVALPAGMTGVGWPVMGHRTYPAMSTTPGTIVASVRCLAESTMLHSQLSAAADCVDLESAHVLSAAEVAGHRARCLLVISDTNNDGAVFSSDIARLHPAFDQVCDSVRAESAGGIS